MQYSQPFIDKKKTGEQIRRLMRNKELSVKDVTEKLRIGSVQCVYQWFSGRRLPSVDNLYALAALLDVKVDDILYKAEDITVSE